MQGVEADETEDLMEKEEIVEPLEISKSTEMQASATTSQRIHAVRSEVINALSFFSVVWKLHEEEKPSFLSTIFILTGFLILAIDFYFIYCQWTLKTHHAIPVLFSSSSAAGALFAGTTRSVAVLDDLLSDLPQSIWVICYLLTFSFSLLAMVCAIHSTFSIVENIYKLRET